MFAVGRVPLRLPVVCVQSSISPGFLIPAKVQDLLSYLWLRFIKKVVLL